MNTTTLPPGLPTPSALLDLPRLDQNIHRMQSHLSALGVRFRPHVKTSKCLAVVERQLQAGATGITVSTLKEAEQFFAAGVRDILYAVGIAPNKFVQALALRHAGCDLKLTTDSLEAAAALAEFGRAHGHVFEVWIEVDTDGHRAGVKPGDARLVQIGQAIHQGGQLLGGVMTHAGGSYSLNTPAALRAMAGQERDLCVQAAQTLRRAGLPCRHVSVGSTPTALSATAMDGVTEVRAGVYVFFDLVMANIGVCQPQDIALSVLTSVIGHQSDKGWLIVDAGWMAMSRDRGTATQDHDYGYGQVCDAQGRILPGWIMSGANQEHGIVSFQPGHATPAGAAARVTQFPVGTMLRVLPNHACATAAQFAEYQVLSAAADSQRLKVTAWPRFGGW